MRFLRQGIIALLLTLPVSHLPAQKELTVHRVERARLGAADAVTVELPLGRIVVVGRDIQEIRYTIQRVAPVTLSWTDTSRNLHPGGGSLQLRLGNLDPQQGSNGRTYSPTVVVAQKTWDAPVLPDTTAPRRLPGYEGAYQETIGPMGLRLLLPAAPRWTEDSAAFRPYVDNAVEIYLKTHDRGMKERPQEGAAAGMDGAPPGGLEIRLEVPKTLTHLTLTATVGATILVQDFDGELTIASGKGEVALERLGGAALVETGEGPIGATLTKVTPANPIFLMTGKGDVYLEVVPDHGGITLRGEARGGTVNIGGLHIKATGPLLNGVPMTRRTQEIAGGGTPVRLRTLLGSVYFENRRPGPIGWRRPW